MNPAEFDLHARLEDNHWWFRARREIVFTLLRQQLVSGAGQQILEIGCGTGGNLRWLSQHYAAMGIEIDPYAANLAAQRAGCAIRCGDLATARQSTDPRPDAVLLLDVLEHVQDDHTLLHQSLDLLPVGGLLVLTVPADPRLWSQHDVSLGHFRRYTHDTLRALWRQQAVEVLTLSGCNSLLYPLVRLARAIPGRQAAGKTDLKPVHPLLNSLLYRIFAFERHLLPKMALSWGCSLIAILRKSAP